MNTLKTNIILLVAALGVGAIVLYTSFKEFVYSKKAVTPIAPWSSFVIVRRYMERYRDRNGKAVYNTGTTFRLKDVACDTAPGKAVRAVTDGICVFSEPSTSGLGNVVVLHHPQYGIYTRYAHLDSIAVQVGQTVVAENAIATMGKSGTDCIELLFDILKVEPQQGWRYWPGEDGKGVVATFADSLLWLKQRRIF